MGKLRKIWRREDENSSKNQGHDLGLKAATLRKKERKQGN